MRIQDTNVWPVAYGVVVLVVLGLFLVGLAEVLSPFVLFLALLVLLSPYAGTQRYLLVLVAASFLLLVWMLRTTGFLLAPFILAVVTSYILDPAVDLLERWRVPRALGILLLALPVVALVLVGLIVGVPALADQAEALIQQAPRLLDRLSGWAVRMRETLIALDLPFISGEELRARLSMPDPETVIEFLETQREAFASRAWRAVLGIGQGIGAAVTVLAYVVLTPVLTFYLLRDWDGATHRIIELIPVRRRDAWVAFLTEYDRLLSRYLRGQVAAAAVVGVLTGVGLWILDFPLAGLVGAVAGVFNLVPYLGLIVSLVPALIIAFTSGSVILSLLKVAVVFLVVQLIDSTVVGPRIVGGSVGLHPVWVMLALALGGFFFGFVGLLIAVPVAVLIKLLAHHGIERYRRSRLYRDERISDSG
ncbi:MAG: AI-2E family transporter [Gemmatimonadota bacterium]